MGRFEAAISSLGEADAATAGLKEALRHAPRRGSHRRHKDVHREIQKTRHGVLGRGCPSAVLEAESQLASEEEALREGEQRLAGLERKASYLPAAPPFNCSCRLRTRIGSVESLCGGAAMRARRSLHRTLRAWSRRGRGRSRSLAEPSLDLVMEQAWMQSSAGVTRESPPI